MGPFLQANCVGAVVSWLWLHRTPGLRHGDAHGAAAHAAPFTTLGAFERFGECLVLGAEVGNVSLGPHEESQACGFGRCPTTCDAGWDILDSAPLGEDELLGDVGISPVRAPLPGMKPNTLSRFDFRIQDLKLRVSGTDKKQIFGVAGPVDPGQVTPPPSSSSSSSSIPSLQGPGRSDPGPSIEKLSPSAW